MTERANVTDLEFKWGQKIGVDCQVKEAQFYESFTYDGTEYTLYDCVYMYKEGEPEPYIGKLIGIWETVDKTKEVNVQWFFRQSEILRWLGDQTPMQNEIFLATGEGIGFSNVNALEAIAGKCYVVCTSEDSRNRQPSEEETKLADYIFYRTFDVGLCTILDKMDDKVGGLEVKYVFNREESKNVNGLQTPGNTMACKGKSKLLIPNSSDEFKLLETYGHLDKSVVIKDVKGVPVKSEWIPGESSDYKSGINSNVLPMSNKQSQACASGQRVKTCEVDSTKDGVNEAASNKLRANEMLSSDALQDKPTKKARICNSTEPSVGKIRNSAKNLLEGDNSMMPTFSRKDKTQSGGKDTLRLDEGVCFAKKGGSLKDGPIGILKSKPSNQAKKIVTFNVTSAKDFIKSGSHVERTSGLVKDCVGLKNTSKKERVHENTRKLSNINLPKVCVAEMENTEMEQKVTPRSEMDKGRWYSETDIIEDAFQTSCTAVMVPRSRISSPHSGQALLKIDNSETTRVLRKLSEGCLMLPNGRPLVATVAPPLNSTEGQRTYFGHLVIDRIKLQGDARDAVSTSHCSQPNTIEYVMAMEWCLLQTQFDRCWESLYKLHNEDMRKLKVKLKSK